MPVQFPTLSDQEQKDRIAKISKETGFPYSYSFIIQSGGTPSAVFPGNAGQGFSYTSFVFQADNNLSIVSVELSGNLIMINNNVTNLIQSVFVLSFSPILVYAPSPSPYTTTPPTDPTPPTDIGNEIMRLYVPAPVGSASPVPTASNIFQHVRYHPRPYIVKFNQKIYLHLAADSNFLAVPTWSFNFSLILQTDVTGLKV